MRLPTAGRKKSEPPADVGDILLDELRFVRLRRKVTTNVSAPDPELKPLKPNPDPVEKSAQYNAQVHKMGNLSALCFSGGGIRSAAFALGVAQGLAAREILTKFDYLSTVSGGGYLGGFLTAWAQRKGYVSVCDDLIGRSSPAFGRISPVQHLRRYSSYLTPRKGVLTADTLTVVALYFRNLFLNWLILIPLVLFAVVAMKIFAIEVWDLRATPISVSVLGLTAIVLIGLAVLDSLRQRPGWESERMGRFEFQLYEMWPMLIGSIAASCAALKYFELNSQPATPLNAILGLAFIAGVIHLIAWLIAFFVSRPPDEKEISTRATVRSAGWRTALWTLVTFTISGTIAGLALGYASYLIASIPSTDLKALLLLCFGPPILISAFFLGEMLHVGFTSYVSWGDGEREWLARAAGYHGRVAASWMLIAGTLFGGSYLVFWLSATDWNKLLLAIFGSTGGIAGIVAAGLGRATATAATMRERDNTWKNWSVALVLAIATPVFIIITLSFFSAGIDYFAAGQFISYGVIRSVDWTWLFIFFGSMGVTCLLASFAINSNRFSLHGVYRNRLIRAFLGASRASDNERKPNPFTDFDEKDNINLCELWPNDRERNAFPPQFLVVNCALNILASPELAWQERKALSFTATPRFIGSGALNQGRGCYRTSELYGSGMSLGTAMTISGASASPNMGYHSSSALSVLLTFFNVRLGAWLGNPGEAGAHTYDQQGPVFAAEPLVEEALGLTTEDKPYVYLSDGGHFENLGLYEMVRRRCHHIIVSDAGCDPSVAFEDLGNAVRKISIDMGVKIDFQTLTISARKDPPAAGTYYAVARIHYPEADAAPGLLLYIKPGYHGDEPASVRSYAAKNPIFPHESTTDQWFGESQFEAYRALGQHVIKTIDGDSNKTYRGIRQFIEAAAATLAAMAAHQAPDHGTEIPRRRQ